MTPTTSQSLVGQSSTKPTRNVRGATAPLALIFALGALLCALMASPAVARADHVQVVRLNVGTAPVAWKSPYRLRTITTVSFRAAGHELPNWEQHGCIGYASGYGVLVKLDGCGKGAQPMRLTVTSLRSATTRVLVRYTYQR